MALYALAYCERLHFHGKAEEIRVADHHVYAERTLHEAEVDVEGERQLDQLERDRWGVKGKVGKVDYVRYRDGGVVAFEHNAGEYQ